jgi:hypothetical protein
VGRRSSAWQAVRPLSAASAFDWQYLKMCLRMACYQAASLVMGSPSSWIGLEPSGGSQLPLGSSLVRGAESEQMIRNIPNEDVAFLVTASELRDIKTRRRRKHQTGHPAIQPIELGCSALIPAPRRISRPSTSAGAGRRRRRNEISRTQAPAESIIKSRA